MNKSIAQYIGDSIIRDINRNSIPSDIDTVYLSEIVDFITEKLDEVSDLKLIQELEKIPASKLCIVDGDEIEFLERNLNFGFFEDLGNIENFSVIQKKGYFGILRKIGKIGKIEKMR